METLRSPLIDAPPLERYGLPDYVQAPSPAAGAAFSQAVDGEFHQRLVAVYFKLVTSATVANRTAVVDYRDAEGNRFAMSGAPLSQTASTTTYYAFNVWQAQAEWSVDSTVLVPLAPVLLPPTFTWRIYVANIDTTDAITQVRYVRERFYSNVPLR